MELTSQCQVIVDWGKLLGGRASPAQVQLQYGLKSCPDAGRLRPVCSLETVPSRGVRTAHQFSQGCVAHHSIDQQAAETCSLLSEDPH